MEVREKTGSKENERSSSVLFVSLSLRLRVAKS